MASNSSAVPAAGRMLIGAAMIGVAIICLIHGSFAFQRQPVPISWPFRDALTYASAASLLLAGVGLGIRRWSNMGGIALAAIMAVWIAALHLPRMISGREAAWLAAAECLAVAAGATIVACHRQKPASSKTHVIARIALAAFATSLFAFGIAHFIYAEITASMVPSWMPMRLPVAYLTGAAHVAAGISILSGLFVRLATMLLAIMLGSFTLLVNLPMALAERTAGAAVIDLCFAIALTGSALVIFSWVQSTDNKSVSDRA